MTANERKRKLKECRERAKTMRANFGQQIEEGIPVRMNPASVVPEYEFLLRELDAAYAKLRTPIPEAEDVPEDEEEDEAPVRVRPRRQVAVGVEGGAVNGRVQATRDNAPTSPGAALARELANVE